MDCMRFVFFFVYGIFVKNKTARTKKCKYKMDSNCIFLGMNFQKRIILNNDSMPKNKKTEMITDIENKVIQDFLKQSFANAKEDINNFANEFVNVTFAEVSEFSILICMALSEVDDISLNLNAKRVCLFMNEMYKGHNQVVLLRIIKMIFNHRLHFKKKLKDNHLFISLDLYYKVDKIFCSKVSDYIFQNVFDILSGPLYIDNACSMTYSAI